HRSGGPRQREGRTLRAARHARARGAHRRPVRDRQRAALRHRGHAYRPRSRRVHDGVTVPLGSCRNPSASRSTERLPPIRPTENCRCAAEDSGMTRTRAGGYCAHVKRASRPRGQAAMSAFCVIWALTGTAWALDPNRHITQFGHTAWRTQDGFVNRPVAVTQTTDGYVWIATHDGLVRFDGVKFSPWSPP